MNNTTFRQILSSTVLMKCIRCRKWIYKFLVISVTSNWNKKKLNYLFLEYYTLFKLRITSKLNAIVRCKYYNVLSMKQNSKSTILWRNFYGIFTHIQLPLGPLENTLKRLHARQCNLPSWGTLSTSMPRAPL